MVAATLSEADSVIRNQRTVMTSCIWLGLTAWPDFSPCDICGDPPSGKVTFPVSRATKVVRNSEMKRRNEYFILPFLRSVPRRERDSIGKVIGFMSSILLLRGIFLIPL